jgi:hypothetical protein
MAAPNASPLTLKDLPNDLLRLCARGPSSDPLTVRPDVLRFGMCNHRFHAIVNEGFTLQQLELSFKRPSAADGSSYSATASAADWTRTVAL